MAWHNRAEKSRKSPSPEAPGAASREGQHQQVLRTSAHLVEVPRPVEQQRMPVALGSADLKPRKNEGAESEQLSGSCFPAQWPLPKVAEGNEGAPPTDSTVCPDKLNTQEVLAAEEAPMDPMSSHCDTGSVEEAAPASFFERPLPGEAANEAQQGSLHCADNKEVSGWEMPPRQQSMRAPKLPPGACRRRELCFGIVLMCAG